MSVRLSSKYQLVWHCINLNILPKKGVDNNNNNKGTIYLYNSMHLPLYSTKYIHSPNSLFYSLLYKYSII